MSLVGGGCRGPEQDSGASHARGGHRADAGEVRLVVESDRIRVTNGERPFTEYVFRGHRQPILYPVYGALDRVMVRHFPMRSGVPGEEVDHPHQQSLWFAHGDVNGHDFWAGKGERIESAADDVPFALAANGFTATHRWLAADGSVVCTDERRLRFGAAGDSRWIDYDVDVRASHGPLRFGDTKEGTMAIRLAPTLRLRGPVAAGAVVNSEGVGGLDAWGKRARWVDYWGPIDGEVVGVALFDHPDNPNHPTWWHARDYGLFAANPFGAHDFEGAPRGTGEVAIAAGAKLSFRYRFWFHRGDAQRARIVDRYREWVSSTRSDR
jgi:hypothetical protein